MQRSRYIWLLSLFLVSFVATAGQTPTHLLPVCPGDKKCGFIDQNGAIAIKPSFLETHDFAEGLAAVKVKVATGEKYGFIDATGKIAIDPKFDQVESFNDGFALFKDGKSYGFVDRTGRELPARWGWARSFSDGLAVVWPLSSQKSDKSEHSRAGFIDISGDLVIDYKFDSAESFSEGLAAACVDRKCGYIDRAGRWEIQPTFDHAESFSEGLAVVSARDGMELHDFGFIDRNGKVVIPMKYRVARSFSEGLAAVLLDTFRYGYVNKKGEMVIPPDYYEAYDFSDGLAVVLVESSGEYFKKFAYIDRTGKRNSSKSYSYAGKFKNGIATVEKRNFFAKLDSPLGKLMVCTRLYINKAEKTIWKENHWGCE